MEKISVLANCSRINCPGKSLRQLVGETQHIIQSKKINYDMIRSEIDKWIIFAAKFHPTYARRATLFLDDEQKKDFELIESK